MGTVVCGNAGSPVVSVADRVSRCRCRIGEYSER